jgi:hypothetical protein
MAIRAALLLTLLCGLAGQAWAATTTTTLTVSSTTVNSRPVTVLTASVTGPSSTAVGAGLVRFYDGKLLLGSGQIVTTGKKYTHGTAHLSLQLSPGSHALKAVFVGTSNFAGSTSAAKTAVVSGGVTATTISSTGSAGAYTLTGTVSTANSIIAPTGKVQFLDQTNSNALLGSASLGSATVKAKFATAVSYSIYDPTDYYYPYQVVVADFNGDGILDFAEVDYSARISVHLGNGNGTFQAAKPFCTTGTPATPCQAGSEPQGLAVGDFNSDGILDLVVVDEGQVGIALGNGDGTFQEPVYFKTVSSYAHVTVADLNMDGTPDLVVPISGGLDLLLGNGDGTFQPHNEIGMSDNAYVVAVGDFNKDGIPDIAAANNGTLMFLPGVGDGTFGAEVDTTTDVNAGYSGSLIAVDFKGTGYLSDVAVTGSGKLEVYFGDGKGGFKLSQTLYPNTGFDENVTDVLTADLNGDGIADLALCYYYSDSDVGKVAIFSGKGDGTFNTTPTRLNVGKEPISIAAGDFTGTGAIGLVVANENDNTLSVLPNSVALSATAAANVTVPGVGTHNVLAQYVGDTAYTSSQSSTIALAGNGVATPVITSLSPATAVAGGASFTLTIAGTGLNGTNPVITWNGTTIGITTATATKIVATIPAADIAKAGSFTVKEVTGGGSSNGLTFTVTAAVVGPVITSLSPSTAVVGSAAFTLTVNGTGFASGAVVKWNGSARTTAFKSATQLTAAILATDVAAAGSFPVTVTSGGATSAAQNFTVTTSSIPTLTAISPNYAVVGSPQLTITVSGSGFISGTSGTIVFWQGVGLTTTYVSTTQVTAIVPATKLATVGTFAVTAHSSGTGISNTLPFTVAPATHTPLAYGFFTKTATPGATSGNITCSWDSSNTLYACAITGEDISYNKYVVNVTNADPYTPAFVGVNSAIDTVNSVKGDDVIIKFYNPSGTPIQAPFYIVVYKP